MSLYLGETPICGGIEGNQLSNPFSLLDYKFSEYEISNASWLRSNGQYNSGTTYADVYNLLLQIYNGTVTKAGVSVKLSTETYEDTDFVLNTTDTTFRLPLKVALASGKAVAGNGMTLGLTNGTQNGGTYFNDGKGTIYPSPEIYGGSVNSQKYSGPDFGGTMGITLDPTKSGIETSADGLYLYFYVGAVVQDASVIAASQVLSDIAELKRRAFGAPDWDNKIDIYSSLPYICPDDGYLFIRASENSYVVLTSSESIPSGNQIIVAGPSNSANTVLWRVVKGEMLTRDSITGSPNIYFVPFKM